MGQKFGTWAEFFRHARPSFKSNGSWNGATLEPLLLVIAQDAIGQATLGMDVSAVDLAKRDEELRTLATAIVAIIAAKPKGSALALRWAAWLFRITIGALDSKGEQHPNDLHQRATPFWRMLKSLANSAVAKDWNDIGAPDAASEEVLCLLCAKILAASENDTELPDVEPLLRCLPASPKNFLAQEDCRHAS